MNIIMGTLFALITFWTMQGKDQPSLHAEVPYRVTLGQSYGNASGYQKLAGPLELDLKRQAHFWKATDVHQIKGASDKSLK